MELLPLLEEAMQAQRVTDYGTAIKTLFKGIEDTPSEQKSDVYNAIGINRCMDRDFVGANHEYARALHYAQTDNQRAEAWLNMADVCRREKDSLSAEGTLGKAAQYIHAGSLPLVEYHRQTGLLQFGAEKYEAALGSFMLGETLGDQLWRQNIHNPKSYHTDMIAFKLAYCQQPQGSAIIAIADPTRVQPTLKKVASALTTFQSLGDRRGVNNAKDTLTGLETLQDELTPPRA